MFRKITNCLFPACLLIVLLISCNGGKSSKKINTEEQYEQYLQSNQGDKIEIYENIAEYEKLIEQDSHNIELRITLASNYYSINKYDKAINHFMIVNKIDENNLTVLIALGNINYDIDQNRKAIEFYEKAIKRDSLNLNVRCDMGTCYKRIEMYKKAIQIFKENIEINYNHAPSHFNLFVVYNKIDNKKGAEDEKRIYDQIISSQQQSQSPGH